MKFPRELELDSDVFRKRYLGPGVPVIVSDAMKSWNLEEFGASRLCECFGSLPAQIYDESFALIRLERLGSYIDKYFGSKHSLPKPVPYVRWYCKFRNVEFAWADEVFDRLGLHWKLPAFFPRAAFLLPDLAVHTEADQYTAFPYRALFVSARGAMTREHIDPLGTSAVLCQLFGAKKLRLELTRKNDRTGLLETTHYEDILGPGEIAFIPRQTRHEVVCLTDSISITWNFSHVDEGDALVDHLRSHPDDDNLPVVQFFLRGAIGADAPVDRAIRYLEDKIGLCRSRSERREELESFTRN